MNISFAFLLPIAVPFAAIWWIYSDTSQHGDQFPIFWAALVGFSFVMGFLLTDLSNSASISKLVLFGDFQIAGDLTVITALTLNTLIELLAGTTVFVFYLYWEKRGIFS